MDQGNGFEDGFLESTDLIMMMEDIERSYSGLAPENELEKDQAGRSASSFEENAGMWESMDCTI